MNEIHLKKVAERHEPKRYKLRNALLAFVFGGLLAVIGQFAANFLVEQFQMKADESVTVVVLAVILITALCTGLGIYDNLAQWVGAGLFIPISGFANSLASEALESKSEGLIMGIGSNMFKLAGSVLTYGIVAAIVFSAIRYGVSLL